MPQAALKPVLETPLLVVGPAAVLSPTVPSARPLPTTMKPITEILQHLRREGVTECILVSGCLPCVMRNGALEAVDTEAPSTDLILEMLMEVGGIAYVDKLGAAPTRWGTQLDSVGALTVLASRAPNKVQVKIVRKADQPNAAPPRQPPQAVSPQARQAPPAVSPPLAVSPPAVSPPLAVAARAVQAPTPRIAPAPPRELALEVDSIPLAIEQPSPFTWDQSVPPRQVLERLLREAVSRNASDLHIVAERPPLFRVRGELVAEGSPIDAAHTEAILLGAIPPRLKEGFERDGSCDFALDLGSGVGRFRTNFVRQRTGLKGSFRVIGEGIPTLSSLGLPTSISEAMHHHQGLIVITGPTGHGKTTLAAVVDIINSETTHHIITVEDPIEYLHPRKSAMISQREVGTHTKSFGAALKASLREDPDVIVVGELRDTETVRMALSASETGHLVIGTMNTPSAAKTIDRLIDLFPPGDQAQVRMTLAGGLRLIISQRLLPRAKGAEGRPMAVAAELLPGSIALWTLIRDNKTYQIPSLQQRGKGAGITRLDDSLGDLVRSGQITQEEALANAESPDELATGLNAGGSDKVADGNQAANVGERAGLLSRAGALFGKKGA